MKKPITDAQVGVALRIARKWRGLSQSQLGEEIGVTYQQVQKYERGASPMRLTTWLRACAALDMKPETMLGLAINPKASKP
jgi:transcriptional regulator with XRE-family HTH domain